MVTRRGTVAKLPTGRPGSDAESHGGTGRLARLWQAPLLLASLALLGYAAYLFVDPGPGSSVGQKIELARAHLRHDRPEAAAEQLHRLLASEKLARENEAVVHLLLAESIDAGQRQRKLDLPANHERIIEQSRIALTQGAKPDAVIFRRMGESYEALGNVTEALKHYRRAMAMDTNRAPRLQRKVIDLQIATGDGAAAEASLDEYLKDEKLADTERGWALGEKSRVLADRGNFVEARALLGEALRLDAEPISQGEANFRLGYCAWKLGNAPEAERLLRAARGQLGVKHPLEAEAAYTLGRVLHGSGDAKAAAACYESVLVNHPDSPIAQPARLGRGVCRIALGEDRAGLTDLHDLVYELTAKPSRQRLRAEALAGLRESAGVLGSRDDYQGALEALGYERTLDDKPGADFYSRLAAAYEKRADQVEHSAGTGTAAGPAARAEDKFRVLQQVKDLRTKAGDAFVAYARVTRSAANRGEALGNGVDLYERAGATQLAIAALDTFAAEHPEDAATPDALLRLGRFYQSAGRLDTAIATFRRNQARYPQSLAAACSGLPLARCYVARGARHYPAAEAALLAVLDDNPLIASMAEEYGEALVELGQLYYRMERYEDAVARLEQAADRYPTGPRATEIAFLTADSFRKGAAILMKSPVTPAAAPRSGNPAGGSAKPAGESGKPARAAKPEVLLASADDASATAAVAERAASDARDAEFDRLTARRDRLERARQLYGRVIELAKDASPASGAEPPHLRLSHFFRADCAYELGDYEEAIRLYDAAAARYRDDPSSLAAYVQIVNAYRALGKPEKARAAGARARAVLKKMPGDAFQPGKSPMPREYWEKWLAWANESGMF